MRKIKNFAMMMLVALTATLVFTSCDKDVVRAMDLSGEWEGDFGMKYSHSRYGVFNSYDTQIVFYPDYEFATHGYGKQIDYYEDGPYEYRYHTFNWSVRNEVITLTYPGDHNLDVDIYDYSMSGNYFSGYFQNTNKHFRLKKIGEISWNGYSGNYDYHYRDGYDYYAKTRAAEDDASDAEVKSGNRFAEVDE